MSFCKYHPLKAANYRCKECYSFLCHDCVDELQSRDNPHCLICNSKVESLGVTADTEPFWRRLDKGFQYPINTTIIFSITLISIVSTISNFLPFPLMIGINLILSGVILKFCFICLSETASGEMRIPKITDAFEGGIILIIKLLIALLILFFCVYGIERFISAKLATLVGFLLVFALPAMLILYALSEKLDISLNPFRWLSIITNIGLPYCLLLAIAFVMLGSIEVLTELLSFENAIVSLTLQSMVFYYYSIVIFHLMGYMIFQYQHRFGFNAVEKKNEQNRVRSTLELELSKIEVLTKEGQWIKAVNTFIKTLRDYPNDAQLQQRFFLFILNVRQLNLSKFLDYFFNYLLKSNQPEKLSLNFKLARRAYPSYLPESANLRHQIAQSCFDIGNPKYAISLLKDLHKTEPNYPLLAQAYHLLADALESIPGFEVKANQYRELTEKILAQQPQKMTGAFKSDHTDERSNDTNQSGELPPIDFK